MTPLSTLIISTLFTCGNALVFAYVAWRLRERTVLSPEAYLAWQLFIVWWIGMAAFFSLSAALRLLGTFNMTSLPLFLTVTYIQLLFFCAALWGLLYYLIYLFTGSTRQLVPLSIFYLMYYALLLYYTINGDPKDVIVGRWGITFSYNQQTSGLFLSVVLILLLVPPVIAGLLYFMLFFRLKEATQKYRVLLLSGSIVVWFGSGLVGAFMKLSQFDWWQITSRCIGLAAILTIFSAYFPPHWIRKRYGIASLGEEPRVRHEG